MSFKYVFNNNHYYQEELKFIQFRELTKILAPFQDILSAQEVDAATAIETLGDNFSRAVAIVLIPEGKTVRERNVGQAAEDLGCEPLSKIEKVVEDFFLLNDPLSHVQRWTNIFRKASGAEKEKE